MVNCYHTSCYPYPYSSFPCLTLFIVYHIIVDRYNINDDDALDELEKHIKALLLSTQVMAQALHEQAEAWELTLAETSLSPKTRLSSSPLIAQTNTTSDHCSTLVKKWKDLHDLQVSLQAKQLQDFTTQLQEESKRRKVCVEQNKALEQQAVRLEENLQQVKNSKALADQRHSEEVSQCITLYEPNVFCIYIMHYHLV